MDRDARGQFTSRKKTPKPAIRRSGIVMFLHVGSGTIGGIESGGEVLGLGTCKFVYRAIIGHTHKACVRIIGSSSDLDLHRLHVTRREPDARYGAGSRHGHSTKMK